MAIACEVMRPEAIDMDRLDELENTIGEILLIRVTNASSEVTPSPCPIANKALS
jgi:hypothetical protein